MNLRPGRPRPSPLPLLVTLSERLQRSTSEVLERRERRLAVALTTLIIALTLTTAAGSVADERGPQDRMIEPSPATTSETTTAHNATAGATHSPATEAGFPLYMRLIATLACLVIFTVGVCGNLLVPLVVIKTKYLRNSTNLFLINLSIADLLVLIVCMPTVLIELHSRPETWLLGEAMCKLSNFIEMLAANGSIFTILAISFERYYAICKPLKAGYKCTRLRATIIICFIWLLSCILTSPILIMAKSSETIYIDGSLVYNCILETDTYWPKMYVFVSMFAFFCLPLLVLMLVYWLISRRLIRENVAMMDTNRENLVDSRSNTRLENNSHSAYISSSHISSVFKRHPERIHRIPLLSLLKSKQYRDNQCGKVDSAQILSNYSNQKLNSDRKKINAVLLAHANKTRSFAIRPASMMSSLHREKIKNGKALSLDCHEAIIKNDYEHNDSETCEPQSETGPLSRAHSNSQSYWSSRIVADSNPTNYPSSSADASTSVTVTSSSEHSEERIRSRNEPSEGTKAYFGRLFFANLKSLGQLLKQANLTPLLSSSDRSKSGSQSRNGHSGVDVNEVGSKPDYNPVPISRDDDITVAEMNMSSTSYANRLVDPGEPDSGGRNRASNIEQESLDNAHVRPQSTNAISRSGHEVLTAAGRECQTGGPHHGHSPHNGKRLAKVASVKLRRCESDTRTEARRASLIAQPKRFPEGNNKCARESRGSAQAKSRSKFKWVKGFSISSSTGSTYTNSTCLPSETGSASPSIHISRQQNSPSPPRAFKLRHASRRSTATDAEFVSGSREHSPDKMMLASRKRTAHFDAPRKDQLENGRANLPHSRRMSHTRAHIGQGSRSSSLMHNETENACFSDASSSSSLSIEGESSAKPSWLEALVFQEQQNYQDPQLFSQLQQQLAQQRRLSLQGEDQFSATDLESNNSVFKSFNEQSLPHYAEGPMCAQHLEVVDEDETMNSSTNDDGSSPAEVNVRRKTLEVQSNKQSMVKTRVRRSLTETHDDDHCAERVNQAGANGKRPKHDSDCYEHIDMNSSQHRIMSKINLIAMAHSLTDNLHYKRTGRRFGSHPVISNRTHLVGAEINRDFIAVRDISKKQQMDSRRQVVAMLAFVVACFFLLFFPYRVFTIWLILSTEDQVQSLGMETYYNLTYFSRILIYLHSAINPIAYNLISTKFRRAFMSILLCRGAATRRNFNIDYRHQQEPKCHVNNESRLKVAYKSSKN